VETPLGVHAIAGSVTLPVCVLFELRFGLLAGALADFGGLLVVCRTSGDVDWYRALRR